MTVPQLVLVADDDPLIVQALEIRLKSMGLGVATATNGVTALVMILKMRPDLVIIDVGMPGADGMRVCERLREKQFTAPIMVLTGNADEAVVRRCREINARHMLKGSVSWERLRSAIAALLEVQPEQAGALPQPVVPAPRPSIAPSAPKVLVVDDDPRICQALAIRLGKLGIRVLPATNGPEGFQQALKERPDVVITDYHMPGGGGDYLMHRLRGSSATKATPIIILTGGRDLDGQRNYSLEREMRGRGGVAAYFTKPMEFDQLLAELRHHIVIPANVAAN